MTTEQITDLFQTAYSEIIAEGRGQRLFGEQNINLLTEAVRLGSMPCPKPSIYLEFPCIGQPFLDMPIGGFNQLLKQLPYRYEEEPWEQMPFAKAFRFLSDSFTENFAFGTTWDFSAFPGQLPPPGFYSANLFSPMVVRDSLKFLGRKDAIVMTEKLITSTPGGWDKYYLGFMPQRPDSPIRLGWTAPKELYQDCPSKLGEDLQKLGYRDTNKDTLQEICHPVYDSESLEIQLDLLPDGAIGPTLGICYPLDNPWDLSEKKGNLSQSTKQIFQHLEGLNLADSRWRLLADCIGSRRYLNFDNNDITMTYVTRKLSFLKVKYRQGQPYLSKSYLRISIDEH